MRMRDSLYQKIRHTASIFGLYILTIGVGWYVLQPAPIVQRSAYATTAKHVTKELPATSKFVLITGKPTRIVIPDSGIDLVIDEGTYNATDGSWTLSENNAQYAMMTFLANNHSGSTFIYGHGTDQVFGPLAHSTPAIGSTALLYTDNGRVLLYHFQDIVVSPPEDTSVFSYEGPPILTIQTCTGVVSEWRTMFNFNFVEVIK